MVSHQHTQSYTLSGGAGGCSKVFLWYFAAQAETCPIFANLLNCKGTLDPVLSGMLEMGGHLGSGNVSSSAPSSFS